MNHSRHKNFYVKQLFILLWLGIASLSLAAVALAFILGSEPQGEETGQAKYEYLPLPEFPPPSPTPEEPESSAMMVSPDGSVVVTVPRSFAAGKPRLVFREMSTTSSAGFPSGYPPPIRAFYVALHNPDGTPWKGHAPEAATLAMRLTEQDYTLIEGDPYRLVVQRYNESAQLWEEAPTSLDLPWLRVHITTDTLGLFATTVAAGADAEIPAALSTERPPLPGVDRHSHRKCNQRIISSCAAALHANPDPKSGPPANLHSTSGANSNSNANICTGANTNLDTHTCAHAYANTYSNAYANLNPNPHTCAHADANTDPYTHGNADACSKPHTPSNAHTHTNFYARSGAYAVHQWPSGYALGCRILRATRDIDAQ